MTSPVRNSIAARLDMRRSQLSCRGARKSRTARTLWSDTIAMTAAKLIWKLGPTSDSGHNTSTTPAATAIIRMDSGSRPTANATSTSRAPIQLRTVGTSAPVSSV